MGGIIAMLFNANKKEDTPAIDWQDVFVEWKEQPREQTDDEMFENMMIITKQLEGLAS